MAKNHDENSFVFYRSFYDAIQLISDEALRGRVYDALCAYAFHGTELADDADTLVKMVFVQAKPQIDANIQRRIVGRTGGRTAKKQPEPQENEIAAEPEDETAADTEKNKTETDGFEKKNRRIIIGKPNVNANANENVKENANENENKNKNSNRNVHSDENSPGQDDEQGVRSAGESRFTPPTTTQVENYIAEKQLEVDAEHFMDYYGAKGWMMGKTLMCDWKAALRNWDRQEKRRQAKQNSRGMQKGDNKNNGEMERKFGILV